MIRATLGLLLTLACAGCAPQTDTAQDCPASGQDPGSRGSPDCTSQNDGSTSFHLGGTAQFGGGGPVR